MSGSQRDVHDHIQMIKPLPCGIRLAYGVGHVLNDVCASMWFTYLLVYFHLVLEFDSILSGLVLLVGQVADALATPFVGFHSDKTDTFWLCRYGKRKAWHLLGTFGVLCSFPFIFSPCIHCENSHQWAQMVYYSAFVILFQFSWASVQISHLSLIPDLTPCEHERTSLTAIRYSFTVISNVLVYIITWGILHMTTETDAQICPSDKKKFQIIVLICIGIGAVASFIFHIVVKEQSVAYSDLDSSPRTKTTAGSMMRKSQLYQVGIVYMTSRLFVNLAQVYIPLYLHESLSKGAESLAVIPLVMFLASFVMSLLVKPLNLKFGRKGAFLVGAVLGVAASLWIYFEREDNFFKEYAIYAVAVLIGAGGSVMLVTSLGITADLIGPNTESGAFVYGAMSFSDKLSNGLAVTLIQYLKCSSATGCPWYYGDVLGLACGGAAVIGLFAVVLLQPFHPPRENEDTSYSPLDEEQLENSTVQDEEQKSIEEC